MDNTLKQRLFKVILPVVAILAIALAIYFYSQLQTLRENPQAIAEKEAEQLVAKVSKLIVLPAEEVPTVATVSDPEALKDQAFFAKAVMGDKVLIYTGAKRAILYSVALNRIIDVAPLNIGAQKAVTPPKPAPATTTETDSDQ